jgi:hypothetical protein
MYYRFSTFYKRDVNFIYNQEINEISWLSLSAGNYLEIRNPLIYTIDKINSYLEEYDVLPTIGIPLVSKKWKDTFKDLDKKDFQLLDVIIKDRQNNENVDFFALNILQTLSCLDKEKSVFEIDEDNDYDIKKFYIIPDGLQGHSIIRMEEHTSYIIVSEELKKRCNKAHLKGINFIEEGYTIYTDL